MKKHAIFLFDSDRAIVLLALSVIKVLIGWDHLLILEAHGFSALMSTWHHGKEEAAEINSHHSSLSHSL